MGAEQDQSSIRARKHRIERRTEKRASGKRKNGEAVVYNDIKSAEDKFKRMRKFPDDSHERFAEMKSVPCPATHSSKNDEEAEKEESPKPIARRINKYNRYEPGVSMNKEELKKWRKEARRVRNRESAAASRNKTRERIMELESEVDGLRTKYESALHRIAELELLISSNSENLEQCNSKIISPVLSGLSFTESSLETAPLLSLSSDPLILGEVQQQQQKAMQKGQEPKKDEHIIDMISQPNA